MNTSTEATKSTETSLARDLITLIRYYLGRYLGGRRGLIILTVAVLAIGGWFNWGWLVAAGMAPILLAAAPCAVMCALGLCMKKGDGKSCSSGDQSAKTSSRTTVSAKPREEA